MYHLNQEREVTKMTDAEQKKIFASRLLHYINISGKTQKDVAKDLGYNVTTLNTWCTAKSFPSAAKIQTLADYFHIRKSDLVDENPSENIHYKISFKDLGKLLASSDESTQQILIRQLADHVAESVTMKIMSDAESKKDHDEQRLLQYFGLLNGIGRKEALDRLEEMTNLKKYTEGT